MISPELVPKYTQSLAGSLSTVVSSLFSFPRVMLLQLSLLLSMFQVCSRSFNNWMNNLFQYLLFIRTLTFRGMLLWKWQNCYKTDLAAAHEGVVGDEGDHQPRPALAGADLVRAERRPLGQAEHHLGQELVGCFLYF